ncbi:carA2 [Symbiodinium sp. CCMP2456]|nr:carA2 [Symbiodinium sp. CCMP2456]
MMYRSYALLGLTVWLVSGLVFSRASDDASCASAPSSGHSPSLLAVKAETHSVAGLAVEDAKPVNSTNVSNATNVTLEGLVKHNIADNMNEINAMPKLENRSDEVNASNVTGGNSTKNTTTNGTSVNGTNGTSEARGSARPRHGFGELAVNLEFITLKLAQLETVAELQQVEIHKLLKKVDEQDKEIKSLKAQAGTPEPTPSFAQEAQESRVAEAQSVFKKVVQKHLHQRQKREFVTPFSGKATPSSPKPSKARAKATKGHEAMMQRSSHARGNQTSLDTAVSAKFIDDVVDSVSDVGGAALGTITDGTGMIGDALGDAYEHASDQISFVANTVIDTVEMAVTILLRGFTDWDAACPDMQWPSMTVNSNGLYVDWGKQYCYIRLMGQSITLLDFDFGDTNLNWPEPIKTVTRYGLEPIKAVVNIGREVVSCATEGSVTDVFKCFGNKLLEVVPPLNFLNRIGDMIQEFIEVFAHIATAIINTILKDSSSLIQTAVNSSFPAVGAPPLVHHSGRNLVVKTHAQRRPGSQSSQPGQGSGPVGAAQVDAKRQRVRKDDDDDDSDGGITFEIHDNEANYATKLITQFAGKETDTSSCLAFAPKTRRGTNNKVTKRDWQVGPGQDFIQLEPWAVPCDNSWMQENPDKWEGYSFYTWESAIEKCVTVSYSMSTQPVLAFVGGLEFDLLPSPLTEMETTVCWPDKQPGGVDLSVLRTVILSGGVQLFSRTLRLTKRFGSNTDFEQGNIFPAHETWRNPIGIATGTHGVEDDRSLEAMDREAPGALLQNDTTRTRSRPSKKQDLHWSEEEVSLASMLYDRFMNKSFTKELRGKDAREQLRLMQQEVQSDFQLFSFSNPGLVSFNIRGILSNNNLQIGLKVSFGPFTSPEKLITLVNIVDHYRLILSAMPFVSVDTRLKAMKALQDFSASDVANANAGSTAVVGEDKPSQNYKSGNGNYLAFSTRQHGQVTNLWNELTTGDMTWEVVMKFHETPPDQTNIMGSYEFNDNTYSTSNRRRSVGLFVRPDGNHFIGGILQGPMGTSLSGPNLFDHKWHHVVLVLSKSTQQAYYFIDGVKINSCSYPVGNHNPSMDGTITIGGGHLSRNFANQVSRFAIWSRAWSQEDATLAKTCRVRANDLRVLYTLDGGYEDIENHYLDLRSVGSAGAFVACTDCQHCSTYASTAVSIR